jgi:hypothetical protein
MAYEYTDPLINGLRTMARVDLVSALVPFFGASAEYPATRSTLGYPITLDDLEALQLPSMAIFIEREDGAPIGRHPDERLTIVFDYFMAPTPTIKLDARYGALHLVWRKLVACVRAGVITSTPTPTTLHALGVQWVFPEHSVTFDHATDGERAFPHFTGRIPFRYRAPDETVEYADLVELLADLNRVDGNPAIQPQVQVLASLEE